MPVNADKPQRWKQDTADSVTMYNNWFMNFAPEAFRQTRIKTTDDVKATLRATDGLMDIQPSTLRRNPGVLPTLRMATCPPIAVDRLVGLSGAPKNLVSCMERGELPARMKAGELNDGLGKIATTIEKMADPDIFVWLNRNASATEDELARAATIVADRLCGAVSNPIIRNEQERRQLKAMKKWLEERGYKDISGTNGVTFDKMSAGTFSFRMNVPVKQENSNKTVNIPVDAVIMPMNAASGEFPILFEAKSAGDFTNVNKRRKEEATKMSQLRSTYKDRSVRFNLFLCGYFDSGYLGYEAAEGIDWVWEHRIDDLAEFGL